MAWLLLKITAHFSFFSFYSDEELFLAQNIINLFYLDCILALLVPRKSKFGFAYFD